jgi:hypothetical protein
MKKRLLFSCLLAIIAVILITSLPAIDSGTTTGTTTFIVGKDKRSVVDGSVEPDKIPEHVAYSLLFRLIARRETEEETKRIRAYLSQALGCNVCSNEEGSTDLADSTNADVRILMSAAQTFDEQVGILDQQAINIQARYHPSHDPLSNEDKKHLKILKKKKRKIIDHLITSLSHNLSAPGSAALQAHIHQRMKRKIKWSGDQDGE